MTFDFDTGATVDPLLYGVPVWFIDQYTVEPGAQKIAHDWAYHLIGQMSAPKKFDTVRKHILHQWPFLHALAGVHPEVFDELLAAYAERWATS